MRARELSALMRKLEKLTPSQMGMGKRHRCTPSGAMPIGYCALRVGASETRIGYTDARRTGVDAILQRLAGLAQRRVTLGQIESPTGRQSVLRALGTNRV